MRAELPLIEARVVAIRQEAEGVLSFELERSDAGPLPPFAPGAHIDLVLPTATRSYSLCNESDGKRYVVAVATSSTSRGGSRFIHEQLRVGARIDISAPRNNFNLDGSAAHSVFIAGGIGITPILSMIRKLAAAGRSWELHFRCKGRSTAPFLGTLEQLAAQSKGLINLSLSERDDTRMSMEALVRAGRPGSHFYCCGPHAMLADFEAATQDAPPTSVHTEYFSAAERSATDGGFMVTLARSGKSFEVRAGQTILETLTSQGVEVPSSCREGVCGVCETRVVDGIPDHRDHVLSRAEHAANSSMMICCSGSLTDELVLDL
ncbi:PDR/VanB family oxidoreductase [Hydrogenophaga sp. BPS33]|uniref:PDR/VanB family oxidoreductase n=1 Tax=Hydrogenophaga sp. BPS33 TaxID=2651974 RepID=UPI00131F85AE|nr:PDR/VanB family oxidoreductase [Hydrogenophaga sp. BPS33]QHE84740.1 oxidoreductase [Hydrogenophaga sp. BPS33]